MPPEAGRGPSATNTQDACVTRVYGGGAGVGRGRGVGGGRTAGKTLTTPVIPAKQCMAQKYWYMPACVKVNSYTNPVSLRIPASQFMLSGEQNCQSAVQDVPLVTL